MSKRTHFFKSVGRSPPPFPLSSEKVPQRELQGSSTSARVQEQGAVLSKELWRTSAASAVDRRSLRCLHNHPRTWCEHTLIQLRVNQATEWHRFARQEFRQHSAINSCPPVINKLVMEDPHFYLLVEPKGRDGGRNTIPAFFMACHESNPCVQRVPMQV